MKALLFTAILVLLALTAFSQPKGSRIEIEKIKQAFKDGNKLEYSEEVTDKWIECAIAKTSQWYFNASPEQKTLFDRSEGTHPMFIQNLKQCLKTTLNEVAANNELPGRKIEVFNKAFLKAEMRKKVGDAAAEKMDVDVALDCIYEKIKYIVPGTKEMGLASDPNSIYAKDILLPCVQLASKNNSPAKHDNTDTIIGGIEGPDSPTRISTLPMNNLQAIGLKMKEKSYYFIIDSGASYVIVSDEQEREYLMEGIITKKDYTDPTTIVVADGRRLTVRKFVLPTLTLGKYTISNVEFCVVPNASYSLLGKSFLNKFTSWSIDNKTKDLILIK